MYCLNSSWRVSDFYQVAANLNSTNVGFAELNLDQEKELAQYFSVFTPTYELALKGQVSKSMDRRPFSDVLMFLKAITTGCCQTIQEVQQLQLGRSKHPVVIGFFQPQRVREIIVFLALRNAYDSVYQPKLIMGIVTNSVVSQYFGFTDTILYYQASFTRSYEGNISDVVAIRKWIHFQNLPEPTELVTETLPLLGTTTVPVFRLFYHKARHASLKGYFLRVLRKMHQSYQGDFFFTLVDMDQDLSKVRSDTSYYGSLNGADLVISITDPKVYERRISSSQFTGAQCKKFIGEYLNGKLERPVRSAPVQEDNTGQVVFVGAEALLQKIWYLSHIIPK
jgi:hypothetical protein